MSRIKNTIKQAVVDAQTPHEKYAAAVYGDKFDPGVESVVNWFIEWKVWEKYAAEGLPLIPQSVLKMKSRRMAVSCRKEIAPFLIQKIKDAVSSGDASYFRKLADHIELSKKPLDPARAPLAQRRLMLDDMAAIPGMAGFVKFESGKTKQQIRKALFGDKYSDSEMDKYLKQTGSPYLHRKSGRPKKANKSGK